MPEGDLFIHRFQQVVFARGDSPAVVVQGHCVFTYRDLWQRSSAIAARLLRRAIGQESVVGIGLPKSVDFIATILAAWRLSAAYVPLDPALPKERLEFMGRDSQTACIVCREEDCEKFSPFAQLSPPLATATDQLQLDGDRHRKSPDDLAYIIYTSGTTGRPKGVAVAHRGLPNLLDEQILAFRLSSKSRSLFLLSTSFDASVSDIGTALLAGAALYLEPDSDLAADPSRVTDVLRERRITHVDIPPALLARMNPALAPDCLETIVIGGEICLPSVVRKWARHFRVVNVYGPTEATVCTSLSVCDSASWERPLIGRPIRGVEYRIDVTNASETDGAGELLIAGPCLAHGYVNRPQLTHERFPIIDGRRYYRSGDLVRCDPDGEYVFVGRLDRQLKWNGHRIEPEEIEASLCSVAEVSRSAVVKRRVAPGSTREILVAFVACHPTADRAALRGVLRDQLRRSLPRWMIPHRIEPLDQLPLTSSGKPDFSVLTTLRLTAAPHINARPATLDEKLHCIWVTVLGHSEFAEDDDFFEIGGDSFGVLEAVALARTHGIDLHPGLILTQRSLAGVRRELLYDPGDSGDAMSVDSIRRDIAQELRRLDLQRVGMYRETGCRSEAERHADGATLLTGATGFLGSRVLESWLRQAAAHERVVCLVRGRDERAARQRLESALRNQRIALGAQQWKRIEVIAGEIELDRFGLSPGEWNRLADSLASVVHCAARVNLLEPYKILRNANLRGTAEALRLATHCRSKRLCYVSTLAVFVETDRARGCHREDDDLARTRTVYGGYAQSKWGAEVLLRLSRSAGANLKIFRLGLLTADFRNAAVPSHDLLSLAIRGLARLGCVPVVEDGLRIDLTPVDFAAETLVHLALREPVSDRVCTETVHIANPKSCTAQALFDGLLEVQPDLVAVDAEEFLKRLQKAPHSLEACACLGLCRWLVASNAFDRFRPFDLFQSTGAEFELTTLEQVARDRPSCPTPDRQFIRSLVKQILA